MVKSYKSGICGGDAVMPFSIFLLGVAAGGALTLFASSRTGADARRMLRRKLAKTRKQFNQHTETMQQRAQELTSRASEMAEAGRRSVAAQGQRINNAMQAAREAYGSPV